MKIFVSILALAISLYQAAAVPLLARDGPVKPSDDPWYNPPSGWEDKPLGSILKSRSFPQPPGLLFLKENLAGAYQIMYRTSDTFGDPEHTTTSVLVPYNANFSRLVTYNIAMDAADWDCQPSYVLQAESNPDGIVSQAELAIIDVLLNQGYVVQAPDYEGPKAAFTAATQAAHAALDSIRAVLQSEEITGVKKDAVNTIWGYSGGTIPSGWAAYLHDKYAKEVDIAGVVMGGLVVNLTKITQKDNKSIFTGFLPVAIAGLSAEYPEMQKVIESELITEKADAFNKVKSQCLVTDILSFVGQDIWSYTKSGEALLTNPTVKKILDENSMESAPAPKIPMMWYQSMSDEIVVASAVEDLYDQFCSQGSSITLHKDHLSEHGSEAALGVPDGVLWLKSLYDGEPVPSGCKSTDNLSNGLNSDALPIIGDTIWGILKDLLGQPVGPMSGV